jgi:hypothetical protein
MSAAPLAARWESGFLFLRSREKKPIRFVFGIGQFP